WHRSTSKIMGAAFQSAVKTKNHKETHMETRLWTVARFPVGSWTTGGRPEDSDYEFSEVYQIPAESREKATKKAQAVRSRLKKKGLPFPTQKQPYREDFK
ncbi:hypothetical protein, partial [Klebsiella pneumoniae]